MIPGSVPVVACVAKRRKGEGCAGDLESNIGTLGLLEGVPLVLLLISYTVGRIMTFCLSVRTMSSS